MAAQVTLFPTAEFPACHSLCGKIYDVNGACVPPAAPNTDNAKSCFCNNPTLTPWRTGTSGVCDGACPNEPQGLETLRNWYTSFCADAEGANTDVVTAPTPTDGSSQATGDPDRSASSSTGGGDWISNHWKWVIMLVILVVGITGIWIGACIWRRRYLARRDRSISLGKEVQSSWGPTTSNVPYGDGVHESPASKRSRQQMGPGAFMPSAPAPTYEEKKPREKKRWTVSQRT